jgi:hypothetical protein
METVDDRSRAAAAPLRERASSRRFRHARSLARALRGERVGRAVRDLRSLVGHPGRAQRPKPRNSARVPRTLVRHFMRAEIWRAYEEALAYEVRSHPEVDVIHKFR